MSDGKNTAVNTVVFLLLAVFWWVIIFYIFFFKSYGAEFVTSQKSQYYLPLGIVALLITIGFDIGGDFIKKGILKGRVKVWGYVGNEMTPDFIQRSKYWSKPHRFLLWSLLVFFIIGGIMVYTQGSVLAEANSATPQVVTVKTGGVVAEALTHVSPAVLTETLVVGLMISMMYLIISIFTDAIGANKDVKIILLAIFGTLAIGWFSRYWHSNVYGTQAGALNYVTLLFAFGALVTIITGSLIVFDISHIINNFFLALFATVAGASFLKWGIWVAWVIVFIITGIDYVIYKGAVKASNPIGILFQRIFRLNLRAR